MPLRGHVTRELSIIFGLGGGFDAGFVDFCNLD